MENAKLMDGHDDICTDEIVSEQKIVEILMFCDILSERRIDFWDT